MKIYSCIVMPWASKCVRAFKPLSLFWYLVNTRLERTNCLNQVHLQVKFSLPLMVSDHIVKRENNLKRLEDGVQKSVTR
jgi:hypothetical protein